MTAQSVILPESTVTWSQQGRSTRDRVADYDWDGKIGPACKELVTLLADSSEDISRCFWSVYLTRSDTRHLRAIFTDELLTQRNSKSARYMMSKYRDPFGDDWYRVAVKQVADNANAGVSIESLLSSFAAGYSKTIEVLAQKVDGDAARFALLADVVQRLAIVEAEAMTSWLGNCQAERARADRRSSSARFRESIASSIEGAASFGNSIRVQAKGASTSARGMLGKTSQVATAAEQSAVAMREAAQTAAGLIRAIEDARSEVEAAAEIATRAS
ncbi:MAG: chemotaxis protein, partial [Sphingomonas sp. 28-66-16]